MMIRVKILRAIVISRINTCQIHGCMNFMFKTLFGRLKSKIKGFNWKKILENEILERKEINYSDGSKVKIKSNRFQMWLQNITAVGTAEFKNFLSILRIAYLIKQYVLHIYTTKYKPNA